MSYVGLFRLVNFIRGVKLFFCQWAIKIDLLLLEAVGKVYWKLKLICLGFLLVGYNFILRFAVEILSTSLNNSSENFSALSATCFCAFSLGRANGNFS